MIPRTAEGAADWLRARRAQSAQARRQADHHRRLAEIWDARAGDFEAEIAAVETTLLPDPPRTSLASRS